MEPHQVLHVGDSLQADFCAAKAAGFQALLLDRSADARVVKYTTYADAGPDYPGKTEADIRQGTITNLDQLLDFIDKGSQLT